MSGGAYFVLALWPNNKKKEDLFQGKSKKKDLFQGKTYLRGNGIY